MHTWMLELKHSVVDEVDEFFDIFSTFAADIELSNHKG